MNAKQWYQRRVAITAGEEQAGGAKMAVADVLLLIVLVFGTNRAESTGEHIEKFFQSGHTSNWAVVIDTSRFWFNYRQISNALAVYNTVKRLGIPDSQIILMLADDMACNPRNPRPGAVYNDLRHAVNIYGDDIEVDYRGYDVTPENVVRVMTGRLPASTPRSKRLLTDERSNVLFYMTGHGGNGFIKFQDAEELSAEELSDAFEQMWQKRRYHAVFFMADTCEAQSLTNGLYSPNILALASSRIGDNSYSHEEDHSLGVDINDQFTFYAVQFLSRVHPNSQQTMDEFLQICPVGECTTETAARTDLFHRKPNETLITEFFGSSRNVELSLQVFNFDLGSDLDLDVGETTLEESRRDSSISARDVRYASQLSFD